MWLKCVLKTGGFLGGDSVRKQLACSGEDFPPEFFHHDERGNPLPGFPPVRMFGNGYQVSLLGVGEQGRDFLLANLDKVIRAFHGTTAQVASGQFRIRPGRESLWDVRSCVLKVPRQHTQALIDGDFRAVDDIVTSVFGRALRRQVRQLCPHMTETVARSVIRAAPYRSVAVKKAGNCYLPALDLLVRMPFRLEGPWQFGSLQAKGYGRCRPARRPQNV